MKLKGYFGRGIVLLPMLTIVVAAVSACKGREPDVSPEASPGQNLQRGNEPTVATSPTPASNSESQTRWIVPTVSGLTPGKSTETDVKRLFGNPAWEGVPEEPTYAKNRHDEYEYEFHNVTSLDPRGNLVILFDAKSKIVQAITVYPNSMTRDEAILRFGNEFFEVSSNQPMCYKPTSSESKEKLQYPVALVYPERGMYVLVRENGEVIHLGYGIRCL